MEDKKKIPPPEIRLPEDEEDEEEEVGEKKRCPIYFGIKSYLHNFYDPPDKEALASGEYLQDDGFHYRAEPVRKPWTLDRICTWLGFPLLFLGVVGVLVGQLTPPREPVIGFRGGMALVDRYALSHNANIQTVRLCGLGALCVAALLILLSFLLSAYSPPFGHRLTPYIPPPPSSNRAPAIPVSGIVTRVQPPAHDGPPPTALVDKEE